ncbi:MAG TPA: SDR family oxidoreductase [Chthoniobacterales bacterium]|jgi:short-subunit dehydrogenase|nr:SDR family oxidoreductase [Chthoniobacterales bacterium]
MMSDELKGRTALVTGASSGMGVDYARELARRGANLILVARRRDALDRVAKEVRDRHGIEVRVAPADLSDAPTQERLYRELETEGWQVDLLVNNAGFGLFGKFAESDWERVNEMLQIDIVALSHLTRLFTPGMIVRRWGRILLIASTAAFQPVPIYASYGGAKSYVLSFGVALNHELRGTGVSCTVACPGVTATEFFQVAGQRQTLYQRMTIMPSAKVAEIALKALLEKRAVIVAGRLNAFMAWSMRLMPRTWAAALAYRLMKN